ncbi:hypothetical protein GCM10010343_37040 [Streptomyces avidinii]|nr:hypothetical protein GCM10010343_37040 [Streptomyces avidinii]
MAETALIRTAPPAGPTVDPNGAGGEGFVHPLGRTLRLPHGLAPDAPAGAAGSVESMNGALGTEAKGVGAPLGGAAARPRIRPTGVRHSAAGSAGPHR